MIAYIDGSYRCYSTTNGITRHYLGCRHGMPREAIRHVVNTNPYVSPVSGSGVVPSDRGCPPSPGAGLTPLPEPVGSQSTVAAHPVIPPSTT